MSLEPTVCVIGEWKQAEFGEALAWLKTRAGCLWFDEVAAALSGLHWAEGTDVATAILLVQSRPGQISRGEVEQLHARAPLARLVGLLGAWCEGETRSGQPWPGVMHVAVGTWRTGLEEAIGLDAANGHLRLPRTATAVERIDSILGAVRRKSPFGAKATVFSSRLENYEAIADMLQRLGLDLVLQSEVGEFGAAVDVVVFDGWENVGTDCYAGNGPPRVLLLHFPREEDFVRAKKAGINVVLQTPLLLNDLAGTLDRMVHNAGGPLACASFLYEEGCVDGYDVPQLD